LSIPRRRTPPPLDGRWKAILTVALQLAALDPASRLHITCGRGIAGEVAHLETSPAGALTPADEAARLAAVRRYRILDTPSVSPFERVAGLAARLLDAPMATVSIVGAEQIWLKARHGLDQDVVATPRAPGLCASAILEDCPYVVTDTATDPCAQTNPLVVALGLRFYAAAPITTDDGHRLGTVNVMDRRPRQPERDDLARLRDLAAIVAGELELRLAAERAVEAERGLRAQLEREKELVEQIAALEAEHSDQLRHALEHRITIEQAKGVLMGREGVGEREAFERLRSVARSLRRPVEELAREVVAGRPLPALEQSARQRPRRSQEGRQGPKPAQRPPAARAAAAQASAGAAQARTAAEGRFAGEFADGIVRITHTVEPYGLRIEGEIDRANNAAFATALAAVVNTDADVYLDLAALQFIDVAGLRLLMDTAKQLADGQYLVLHRPAPYLRRIMALVGWDQIPGIRIDGDDR